MSATPHTLRRTVPAPAQTVWELWTTAAGIEQWWAPDGFTTEVQVLDLRPGGELVYTMTATAAPQVEFLQRVGMPLSTQSRKTFIEIDAPTHLAYSSLIDFVPDHEPYDHLTVVELASSGERTEITMVIESLHDEDWTGRLIAGRTNELDNLEALLTRVT